MILKKPLGQTDMMVSVLGLGTVKFGRNQGMKYPTAYELPSDQTIRELLAYAKDHGVNLIDTAAAYGTSEQRLGQVLQGQRQDWVIVSKAGEDFVNGQSLFDFSPQHLTFSVQRSLRELQTDYLDVLLVHSDGQDLQHIEQDQVFDTLEGLKKQGLIRAYGMSTKTLEGAMQTVLNADVVMVAYSPMSTEDSTVIDFAYQQNKGVLVKKAFASGYFHSLTGGNPVEESVKFVLTHPGVSSMITGTINRQHLAENIAVVEKITAFSPQK
jgi:aryl-alcohol dehydrogenase-like predicted oxidoreductase